MARGFVVIGDDPGTQNADPLNTPLSLARDKGS